MPANAGFFLVRLHDHGHGVPANDAFDAPLNLAATCEWAAAAGKRWCSGKGVVAVKGRFTPAAPQPGRRLLQQLSLHARRAAGVNLPFTATTPYQNTIRVPATAALSRQPGNGAPHQEPGALERPGHGGAGQQDRGRHRRPHFDVRFGSHALRSRVQSFSAGAD